MPTIGTHDGCFHCDEVFAVFLLKQLPEYKDATIVRTRDIEKLAECDVVVDVGFVYDPVTMRFDHHQKYNIQTGLSARVKSLNPWWNHPEMDSQNGFNQALELVGSEFLQTVKFYSKCWWPARQIVSRAIQCRESIDPSKYIIILEQQCPWKSHVFDLEQEAEASVVVYPKPAHLTTYQPVVKPSVYILFVILPSDNGTWIVQAVPKDKFGPRLSLPESWRALQNKELCTTANIDGCIFVHNTGHVGGNETKEGAIEMARYVVRAWLKKTEEVEKKQFQKDYSPPPQPVFNRGSRANQRRPMRTRYRGGGDRALMQIW